ncbi:hypothetical protein [Vibrio nigripulchritudo]|uniref:hypothetical protein n=1 Tax=Vibrio nigripulchritudo TaxID=28173 RepID=UPI0005FA6A68|nr:hypothetical protein [Vibrio nigripulchritudo]KJY78519.1 hypothetical protein TW74_10575 [Vibrio nigripulchritudo]
MKRFIALSAALLSTSVYAGGWTSFATPTRVDIERGNGFMVYGNFGNPGNCTIQNRFYVQKTHPQYKEVYSMVLAAFTSGKRVQVYIHSCNPVGWYSVSSTTYNTMTPSGAINISN